MPRFAKGEWQRLLDATHEAYQLGETGPLEAYKFRVGNTIPIWARREIERSIWNIGVANPRARDEGELDRGFPRLSVPSGSSIVDALIDVGNVGRPEFRTARVHLEGWMTDEDVLNTVAKIVESWVKKSGQADDQTPVTIASFWRVR